MASTIDIQRTVDQDSARIVAEALERLEPFGVLLSDRQAVEAYLAANVDLAPILEGLCASARNAFGPRVELSLELYKDREQDDEYPTLYVRKDEYEPGILEQLESIMSPFHDQLAQSSGNILVTTDYRRPRGNHGV